MNELSIKLVPPCSYQGGKIRLAKQIVDIIFEQNVINETTKFYDLCCGSGAITLELINRGISPSNITMVDNGVYGVFWSSIAKNMFDLDLFKSEINKLPEVATIQRYLQDLSNKDVDFQMLPYHYLFLQSGVFGGKQIWTEKNRWKNNSFRSYWQPTKTSNRRSPVNPMMPMPNTLYDRVKDIVHSLSGRINALHADISKIDWTFSDNTIVYIDPPYKNTVGYACNLDYAKFICMHQDAVPIYVSEGYKLESADCSIQLSSGRTKGNINGTLKKKPVEEWLNIFLLH